MKTLICNNCNTDVRDAPLSFRSDACTVCGSQDYREGPDVTFHSIEPVGVPATCGECNDFVAQYGFGNVPCCEGKWPERFFNVSADSAPPSTCPKRTETPLPTSGGGCRKPDTCSECACVELKPAPEIRMHDVPVEHCGKTGKYIFWDMYDDIPDYAECPIPANSESRGARAAMLVMEEA